MRDAILRGSANILLTISLVSLSTSALAQGASTPLPAAACASLQGLSIPAMALRLPAGGALVQTAVAVPTNAKDNPNGDFCKVTGIVKPKNATSPSLEFEVNLPVAWNRRVLQMGGGGYDGTLVTGLGGFTLQPANVDNPLKQGFVTVGTDGGHKSAAGFDGSFAMDDEALANFGKESVKKGHDVALEIIKKAYGRAPERSYFIGGSQGGHEALDAAARYSEDYDGVVAHYPAYNVTLLHLGSLNAGRAVYEGGGAAWLSPAKTKLITDAVYATCDGLDGAKDGIISQVKACNTAFDVKTLRCANGTEGGDTCLSDAQLAAVAKIASDYKPGFAVAGMDTFPRWPLLEGALFRERSNWGQVPQPSNPLSGKEPLLYTAGDQTAKFIISRNPKLDAMTFDPKHYQSRIATVASIMDVTDVSLETFKAKGGKIILTHGTADDFITPHNTELYYQRQVKQFGQAGVDSFIRFYMIPGFGHGFGPFNAKIDSLMALQAWVEQGQAPAGLTAIDGNPNANRSRPLCEWPKWPKFTGGSWQRRQRVQLRMRGTVDGQRDPSSYDRSRPEVYRAVALMLNTADSGVRVLLKTYWERADYWAYDRERSIDTLPLTVRHRKVKPMRVAGWTTALALLLAQPAFAQEWAEYVNKVDRFSVPAPGEPASTAITWDSEYGAKFPGNVYRWNQGPDRYTVTVVDFSDAERIHAAIKHEAYVGGVGYWVIDIAASVAHAARLYREKPGVKVTYDAFHYVNLITGHMLQLTNPDESRSYVAIYLHENRLYVLDATVAKGQPPPLIFQQSFAMLGPEGNTIRYQSLYYNRFPERQLGGRGGRGGGGGDAGRGGGAQPQSGQPQGGQQGRP